MAQREHIVTLPEEIDVRNAADIAAELTHAISRSSVVITDMHATAFCDCAGVRAMVLAHRRAADSGAELRVVVTAMLVRRIFGLTGVDHLVDLYPSLAAARGMLQAIQLALFELLAIRAILGGYPQRPPLVPQKPS